MCGIAGFTHSPSAGSNRIIERMTNAIRHRGPDDSGFYQDDFVSLGHRRLSIIDLSTGHQPMTNEDGNLQIVFNGEIFNHAVTRVELERAGHSYKTRCDTETILHAFEQFGPDCVQRFRGMFAFAIWDIAKRRLFCARDRLGIKPFYYFWNGRTFAFASEIKALLQHPEVSANFDSSHLAEYLAFGYVSSDETLFSGIRKLMPGHFLTLDTDSGKLDIRQYWDVPVPPGSTEQRSDEDWIAECRQRLEETVRMRLMSDVPLGMFLSGGVDSSLIAAMMTRMVDSPVKTFAVGYREAAYSELGFASDVARHIGTDHHEIVIGMEDFFNTLPRLIWHEDEPITWPSSVSLYFVSELASRQVKVVLTGEGSDELFGGYGRYHFYLLNRRFQPYYSLLPGAVRGLIRSQIHDTGLLSADLRRKFSHTLLGRGAEMESLYLDNFYSAFDNTQRDSLLGGSTAASSYRNFLNYWDSRSSGSPLARMLYADQKTYLVELLMKQDQMSMATSIESRVPFLDHPFVEFSTRVPDHLKLRGKCGKYIIKKVAEQLLPKDIIYRKKMGFPTPIRQWLLSPQAQPLLDGLLDPNGLTATYLDRSAVKNLLERHRQQTEDTTDRIWRLLNLQIWGDTFLTGKGTAEPLIVNSGNRA